MGIIKDYLPRGARRTIAANLGVSEQYVGQVVRGDKFSERVLTEALEVAQKEKERREKRNQERIRQLKKLVS